ncbi:MAG: hypothetical protein LBJ89_00040 [Holosporales bacterium]|jgi:hypothetical protein|nr:hypothetical protein [Holosporales bacterium]
MRFTRLFGASIVAGMISSQQLLATILPQVYHALIAPFQPEKVWDRGFPPEVNADTPDLTLQEIAARYFFSLTGANEASATEFKSKCDTVLEWTAALGGKYRFFWIISAQFFLEKGATEQLRACLSKFSADYVMPMQGKIDPTKSAAAIELVSYFRDCGRGENPVKEIEAACICGCIPAMIAQASDKTIESVLYQIRELSIINYGYSHLFPCIFALQNEAQSVWLFKALQARAKPAAQVESRRLEIQSTQALEFTSVPPAPDPVESIHPTPFPVEDAVPFSVEPAAPFPVEDAVPFPVEPAAPDQAEDVTPSFGKLGRMEGAPEGGVTPEDDLLAGSAIESFSFVPNYTERTQEQWEALAINDLDQFKHDYLEAIYILCEYKPEGYDYYPPFNEVSKVVQQYLITNYDWASALVTPNPYREDSITRFRTDFEAAVSAEAYNKLQANAAIFKEANPDATEDDLLGFE